MEQYKTRSNIHSSLVRYDQRSKKKNPFKSNPSSSIFHSQLQTVDRYKSNLDKELSLSALASYNKQINRISPKTA